MMKMTKVREVSFKFLYHINMSIFSALESTKDERFAELQSKVQGEFDDLFTEFCTSYGREDQEHPDNQLTDEVKKISTNYIHEIIQNFPSLVSLIEANLKNKNISKLEKIDLCCLLIGSYEITYRETPKKVVINEVLSIGQKFGGESTTKFLNAVLDKIQK